MNIELEHVLTAALFGLGTMILAYPGFAAQQGWPTGGWMVYSSSWINLFGFASVGYAIVYGFLHLTIIETVVTFLVAAALGAIVTVILKRYTQLLFLTAPVFFVLAWIYS